MFKAQGTSQQRGQRGCRSQGTGPSAMRQCLLEEGEEKEEKERGEEEKKVEEEEEEGGEVDDTK